MNKLILTFVAAASALVLAAAPAAGIKMPAKWDPSKAEIAVANGVVTVKSPGIMGGFTGRLYGVAGKRVEITAMVRGEGTVQCAINGETGFAYGKQTKLTPEWQKISVSYFTNYTNFVYHIYSQIKGASTYEVKDITATVETPPEMTAADIPGKLFLPADYPGENGKLQARAGAFGGKAVWGKRWYNPMKLPVPANSKPLYYYLHCSKDSDQNVVISTRRPPQNVYKTTLKGAANEWKWVKIGPVKAVALYPEFYVNYSCDAKTTTWLDKVVLSTNGNLDDAALNAVE